VKNVPEGEFKHATYDRLTRTNAVLLLVDHQVGLVASSRYPEPQDLRKNTVGLARASIILGVPINSSDYYDVRRNVWTHLSRVSRALDTSISFI
jgi:hypothetical protein